MPPLAQLAKRIALSNVSELRLPYKLTYALTYRCQLRCGMCNIWRKKRSAELAADEISEFFRRSPYFSWINLSGGEIFLRSDLMEIFGAIRQYCKDLYLLTFPTNGYETDLIVTTVEKLVHSACFPRLMVTVSLDGPPVLHDRIRSMTGSWERAVETFKGLRNLKNNRFDVYFGMTLQDANAAAFDEMFRSVGERIKGLVSNDFHINVMQTSHYYGNSGDSGIQDRGRVMGLLSKIRGLRKTSWPSPVGFLERRYQSAAGQFLQTGRSPVPCQALAASLFMDPEGTVYPCIMHDSPVGNLRDASFDLRRLWDDDLRRSVRQGIRGENCPQCWTPCEAYQSILADIFPVFRRVAG